MTTLNQRLEAYSLKCPQEVLIVTINADGVEDRIMIYKGFSSSLCQATAYDPDVPLIPETAKVISVDRAKSPYNPQNPEYVEQGLTLSQMEGLFVKIGV